MTKPQFQQLLEQGLELQRDLQLPSRVEIVQVDGGVPHPVAITPWGIDPVLGDAELSALEGGLRLPAELRDIYTSVGRTFRYGFAGGFPTASAVVDSWRKARAGDYDDEAFAEDTDEATRLPFGNPYEFLAFMHDGRCELWRCTDDDPAVSKHGSLAAWLEHDVAIALRPLRVTRDALPEARAQLAAVDLGDVRTPADFKAHYRAIKGERQGNERWSILDELRITKLRDLARRVTLDVLDRDLADTLISDLFNYDLWCPWDVITTFAETAKPLFPAADPASAEIYYRIASAYLKQNRLAEALPYFETCVALGYAVQAANVAYALLGLGRPAEAERRLAACEDTFYALDIAGNIKLALDQPRAAEVEFLAAIADHEKQGRSHPFVYPYLNLAALYLREGKLAEAERLLLRQSRDLIDRFARRDDYYPLLIRLFEQQGDAHRAQLARSALAELEALGNVVDDALPRSLIQNIM